MQLKDQASWDKTVEANTDPYGACCVRYAARWANEMEAAMASGETLAECAERTSHSADTEGITGFMYNMSVGVLYTCWIHGDQLRRWHNTDVSPEQAVEANEKPGVLLNSAVLVVATK